jgi:CBS domain-containing protein
VLIEHILQRKGTQVVTTTASTPVSEVVSQLAEHNVGALVVSSKKKPAAGIISERDIVRALATQGPEVLERPARELMTTNLTTCDLRSTVDELMRLMTERRIRHIPVLDQGKLAGIVSIGDVVKTRIDELETETETLHGYLDPTRR